MSNPKIIKNLFIAMSMYFAFFDSIYSVPALPGLLEITQPNGTKFKAYLRGDEFFSWWESERGTVLYRNLESGYFEYAKFTMIKNKETIVSAGIIFTADENTIDFSQRIENITKLNLRNIWRQKREEAKKRLQRILEIQKHFGNQKQ